MSINKSPDDIVDLSRKVRMESSTEKKTGLPKPAGSLIAPRVYRLFTYYLYKQYDSLWSLL